jgi:hypothetical protein
MKLIKIQKRVVVCAVMFVMIHAGDIWGAEQKRTDAQDIIIAALEPQKDSVSAEVESVFIYDLLKGYLGASGANIIFSVGQGRGIFEKNTVTCNQAAIIMQKLHNVSEETLSMFSAIAPQHVIGYALGNMFIKHKDLEQNSEWHDRTTLTNFIIQASDFQNKNGRHHLIDLLQVRCNENLKLQHNLRTINMMTNISVDVIKAKAIAEASKQREEYTAAICGKIKWKESYGCFLYLADTCGAIIDSIEHHTPYARAMLEDWPAVVEEYSDL